MQEEKKIILIANLELSKPYKTILQSPAIIFMDSLLNLHLIHFMLHKSISIQYYNHPLIAIKFPQLYCFTISVISITTEQLSNTNGKYNKKKVYIFVNIKIADDEKTVFKKKQKREDFLFFLNKNLGKNQQKNNAKPYKKL